MSKKLKKIFNVLEYDFNSRNISYYDVLPYFRRCWNAKDFNFEKDEVKDRNTLSIWIKRTSHYNFWARCEYEFLMAPWPYREDKLIDDMKKIDVHEQIMMNIDIITDILFDEFNINENEKN
jgi:hypothetical protein